MQSLQYKQRQYCNAYIVERRTTAEQKAGVLKQNFVTEMCYSVRVYICILPIFIFSMSGICLELRLALFKIDYGLFPPIAISRRAVEVIFCSLKCTQDLMKLSSVKI